MAFRRILVNNIKVCSLGHGYNVKCWLAKGIPRALFRGSPLCLRTVIVHFVAPAVQTTCSQLPESRGLCLARILCFQSWVFL